MGFETRHGNRGKLYYYRKEREGDRVRSVYVGSAEHVRAYAVFDAVALVNQLSRLDMRDAPFDTGEDFSRHRAWLGGRLLATAKGLGEEFVEIVRKWLLIGYTAPSRRRGGEVVSTQGELTKSLLEQLTD